MILDPALNNKTALLFVFVVFGFLSIGFKHLSHNPTNYYQDIVALPVANPQEFTLQPTEPLDNLQIDCLKKIQTALTNYPQVEFDCKSLEERGVLGFVGIIGSEGSLSVVYLAVDPYLGATNYAIAHEVCHVEQITRFQNHTHDKAHGDCIRGKGYHPQTWEPLN
jgi:hypothetical protein